jgi:GWxTD domain-containing protein
VLKKTKNMHNLLPFFLFFSSQLLANHWAIEVKNIRNDKQNTRIALLSDVSLPAPVTVQLQIKPQNSPSYTIQKKFTLYTASHIQFLYLPIGVYDIDLLFSSEKTENEVINTHFESSFSEKMYGSDIFLDTKAFVNPIDSRGFRGEIPLDEKNKLYFAQLLQGKDKLVTVRAVLYKQVENRATISKTATYNSLEQINTILNLSETQDIFSGFFSLKNLHTGKYLIEIFVYKDAELLTEKSVNFAISQEAAHWNATEIDESIEKMRFILPQKQIDSLLHITNLSDKKNALQNVWQDLYPLDAVQQAATYYEKIQKASTLFVSEGTGWKGDRAATYIRYGAPDEKRTFHTTKGDYEGWLYHKWQLSFRFKKVGERFVLE